MDEYVVKIEKKVTLTQQDIDDIVGTALDCGISYWCRKAEVVEDEYFGEYASDQISRGGSLRLYDLEDDSVYLLNLSGFLSGFKKLVESDLDEWGVIDGDRVDCCQVDAVVADQIVQFAVFGEVVYA